MYFPEPSGAGAKWVETIIGVKVCQRPILVSCHVKMEGCQCGSGPPMDKLNGNSV